MAMCGPLSRAAQRPRPLPARGRGALVPGVFAAIFAICLLPLALCPAVAAGTLQGLVTFPGETPPPYMFANRDDNNCPYGIPQDNLQVRQENLGLKNVLVVLESHGERQVRDARAALATDDCRLLPRVQSVPLGTSLELVDKGRARHDIRAVLNNADAFDVTLQPGQTLRRPLVQAGLYRFDCARHPWERAWIYVAAEPYTAVTDDQGRFEIRHIPPGRYRARAWHEGWQDLGRDAENRPQFQPMGEIREVQIKEGQSTSVRFDNLQPL